MTTDSISLADLIGDTTHLLCKTDTIVVRDLNVQTWTYTHPINNGLDIYVTLAD